jgi:hypothetical protein
MRSLSGSLLLVAFFMFGCGSGGTNAARPGDSAGAPAASGGAQASGGAGSGDPSGGGGTPANTAAAGKTESGGGGATGGSGGTTASTGTGGATTAGACDQDLTGTWDLVASSLDGTPVWGTMVISSDALSVTTSRQRWDGRLVNTLVYSAVGAKSLTYQESYGSSKGAAERIDVQNAPSPLSAGSLPLALGGSWTFSANGTQCLASVGENAATVRCQDIPTGSYGSYDWPIDSPTKGATYSTTRVKSAASQFGFLGGQWQATSDKSTSACSMTVAGNSVNISCRTDSTLNGSIQLLLGSDCVLSGSTVSGESMFEVSARRR